MDSWFSGIICGDDSHIAKTLIWTETAAKATFQAFGWKDRHVDLARVLVIRHPVDGRGGTELYTDATGEAALLKDRKSPAEGKVLQLGTGMKEELSPIRDALGPEAFRDHGASPGTGPAEIKIQYFLSGIAGLGDTRRVISEGNPFLKQVLSQK